MSEPATEKPHSADYVVFYEISFILSQWKVVGFAFNKVNPGSTDARVNKHIRQLSNILPLLVVATRKRCRGLCGNTLRLSTPASAHSSFITFRILLLSVGFLLCVIKMPPLVICLSFIYAFNRVYSLCKLSFLAAVCPALHPYPFHSASAIPDKFEIFVYSRQHGIDAGRLILSLHPFLIGKYHLLRYFFALRKVAGGRRIPDIFFYCSWVLFIFCQLFSKLLKLTR